MIILCDVDNVLADDGWRRRFIVGGDYRAYHAASALDSVANLPLLQGPPFLPVVLLTAMPEEYRVVRAEWLERNRVPCDGMLMRPAWDRRPSVEVKRDLIRRYVDVAQVAVAYDDRQDVIDMMLGLGINAVRVWINE